MLSSLSPSLDSAPTPSSNTSSQSLRVNAEGIGGERAAWVDAKGIGVAPALETTCVVEACVSFYGPIATGLDGLCVLSAKRKEADAEAG